MIWTADFLRQWVPVLGLHSAWKLRAAVLHEGSKGPEAQFEIPLPAPRGSSIRLRVPGTDLYTFRDVFLNGIYDVAFARLPECRRIVDVGGNIGCATLRFAAAWPQSRIVSVEPVPGNFTLLEANTAALRASGQLQIFRAAIWGREADLVLANPDNSYATRGEMREARPGDHEERISGFPMDVLFGRAGFDEVDLLKIDVEGAEVPILRGDTRWLGRVNAIAIEFHGASRAESGFDALMEKHRFRVEDAGHGTVFAVRA